MKRVLTLLIIAVIGHASHLQAQIAAFNFSAAAAPVTGWTNLAGNASDSVIAKTSGGLTLSSVAASHWAPLNGTCAVNGEGAYPGTYFPSGS